jgi:hypothetical protein
MQRATVLGVIAAVVFVGTLATAVAVPRYPECPSGTRLSDTSEEEWTDETAMCQEVHQVTPENPHLGVYEIPDRQELKVAIAFGGVIIGGALAAVAFTSKRRGRQSPLPAAEVGA